MASGTDAPPTNQTDRRISEDWKSHTARVVSSNGLLIVLLVWVIFLAVATDGFATRTNVLLRRRE